MYKELVIQLKLLKSFRALADVRPIQIDDADSIIRSFHFNLHNEQEKPLVPGLTKSEQAAFVEAEKKLSVEKEGKHLIDEADQQAEVPLAKKTKTEVVS